MLESILRNEFFNLTGQNLTDEQYNVLRDYLYYYDDGEMIAEDLHNLIVDCLGECFERHTRYNGEEPETPFYTLIDDWWKFPMVKKESLDEHTTVITYRGCKMTVYRP